MAVLLLACAAALSACSSLDEYFEPEPDAVTAGGAPKPGSQGVPGKDQPTPNLATVPDQAPKPQTTPEERKKIADQLIADNRQAQYADKVVRPDQPEVAPPARTPNASPKAKTDEKPDAPAKPVPAVSTTAPAPSAPTASVQMGSAQTQAEAPAPAPTPAAAAAAAAPSSPPAPAASSPGSPSTSALSPTPPVAPPVMTPTPGTTGPSSAGAPPPSPPPLPPVLQEAQSPPPPAAPAEPAPPPVPAPSPPPQQQPQPAVQPPETVTISGRSPRPLAEYVRKSSISALVASVYFSADSAQIKPEDVTVLRQLALEQAKRGGTFRIVSVSRSQAAETRAQEVAKILIDRGVNPGRVYAGTVPSTDPTFGQPRAESESTNRRVDVYLDY